MSDIYSRILERMRHLCSVREYCTSDIRLKIDRMLAQTGYGKDAGQDGYGRASGTGGDTVGTESAAASAADMGDMIISSLKKDGYLSDLRYAAAFARDRASISGWGSAKIRYALAAKGLDRDTVSAALEQIDESRASSRLEKLLETKYRSLASSSDKESVYRLRDRLIRFALGRGYSYDDVLPVVDRLAAGACREDDNDN
ncbi:MAG: RecX family transcriptional regulator [Bacteroidetes bacterium]|uniref:Regulatory protein RecX n=1 Tax=Candidatus Cryptobacteroides intestinavium TaxID=2840766 RepID=A0A9D9EY45_9BACT|nr:RecX family transcriptional regulator [Candidatus Cryptobacteroides intestinavium]